MSLSKNRIKYIRSLELKKHRKEEQVFIAEGTKLVLDLMEVFDCVTLLCTPDWIKKNASTKANEIIEVTEDDLNKISQLKTAQQVFAIFKQPHYELDTDVLKRELCIGLDDIQDPGNLGTIIRLADWFGIENIFCSLNTVEVYNPKVIQATMGAVARVKIHYLALEQLLENNKEIPIYGTFLEGDNIYQEKLSDNGLILMGNEGNGISDELQKMVSKKLFIPNYPTSRQTSESLNVATATAIVCAEFRRQVSLK